MTFENRLKKLAAMIATQRGLARQGIDVVAVIKSPQYAALRKAVEAAKSEGRELNYDQLVDLALALPRPRREATR
jgi:hypothetical protein